MYLSNQQNFTISIIIFILDLIVLKIKVINNYLLKYILV